MGKNYTQEKINYALYNCSPPADQCQAPCLKPGHAPFQIILTVYILGITFYGVEYPFAHFVSLVPAVLSPTSFCLPSHCQRMRHKKGPWLQVNTT